MSDDHHDHDHGHDHRHHEHCHHDHDHRGHAHGRDDAGDGRKHDHHDHKEAAGLHGHDHGPMNGPWWKSGKGQLTIASGVALVTAYSIGKLVPALDPWIFTAAMLVGLAPIARRAIMAALAGTPFSIEMLMTIAAAGAVIIGASEEAAAVVFLFLIGELLEGVAAGKARASIQSLTDLVPKTALLERDGQTREVPAESLPVGAVILVRPGDRIPADGTIVSGESSIDEAPVTGESTPVRKGVDATVFAGTVNGDAALRIRVTAAAADNTIARVVKLVEEAQESKAPTERFIDRFSRYYTPGVVAVAALVALVAVGRLDRIHGYHRRVGRRLRWRRVLRPGPTDIGVTVTLVVWHFLGAGSPDDGYILNMGRNAADAGYLANYYRFYGIPEAPFDWYYSFLAAWSSVSPHACHSASWSAR